MIKLTNKQWTGREADWCPALVTVMSLLWRHAGQEIVTEQELSPYTVLHPGGMVCHSLYTQCSTGWSYLSSISHNSILKKINQSNLTPVISQCGLNAVHYTAFSSRPVDTQEHVQPFITILYSLYCTVLYCTVLYYWVWMVDSKNLKFNNLSA